jgi:histidinol phosphatase-like PHP family hydrolase
VSRPLPESLPGRPERASRRERASPLPQDLHVHTTFSRGDSAVVPEQTVELVARIAHARVLGISDHLEYVADAFEQYAAAVRSHCLKLGLEVNGAEWVALAESLPVDYYLYHCRDRAEDYRGAERLAGTSRPLIVAHPQALQTDLARVSPACLVEINNRYAWRDPGWRAMAPFVARFRFVLGSDAHQPHWLALTAARFIARELGVRETLLFG